MSRHHRAHHPRLEKIAAQLGSRIKAARVRRRMTATELAQRTLSSRPTIRRLEAGDLSISLGVLADALQILGLVDDLDRVAANDELGIRIADARLPRPRRSSIPSLAEQL